MSEGKRVVRQYPLEFKIDAVKLLEEKGYTVSAAANSLGIPKANLTNWRRQFREGRLLLGHRRAQPTAEEAELRRLQGEVKRLEMELAIVKKAAVSSMGQRNSIVEHVRWGEKVERFAGSLVELEGNFI